MESTIERGNLKNHLPPAQKILQVAAQMYAPWRGLALPFLLQLKWKISVQVSNTVQTDSITERPIMRL